MMIFAKEPQTGYKHTHINFAYANILIFTNTNTHTQITLSRSPQVDVQISHENELTSFHHVSVVFELTLIDYGFNSHPGHAVRSVFG